jgi:hypothetical protein
MRNGDVVAQRSVADALPLEDFVEKGFEIAHTFALGQQLGHLTQGRNFLAAL